MECTPELRHAYLGDVGVMPQFAPLLCPRNYRVGDRKGYLPSQNSG